MNLRAFILQRLLSPAQLAVVEALDRPDRWRPDSPLTPSEAAAWASTLRSPIGIKIDIAMNNWCQQQAQLAQMQPTAELVRAVSVAHGLRAGWEMVKTLSRTSDPQFGANEDASPTADAGLDHHTP
jgi:hypothetical protein